MRREKQLLLDEIKEKIDRSSAMVLASYSRLNPDMSSAFRNSLGHNGGVLEVVRKRILIKAAAASGISLDINDLNGHIGVVFIEKDPVQVTKTIYQFAKENEEVLRVIGGRFEGQVCSAKDIEAISKLPSRDEMRSQFLATLEAPLSQTLAVIDSLLTSTLYCLENKIENSSK